MNFNEFKQLVVAQCDAQGITEYELYYQCGEGTRVSVFQHEVSEFSSSRSGGVCFRCIVDGKMGYASTEALTEEQAKEVVLKAADNASVLESEEEVFLGQGGQTYQDLNRAGYDRPSTEALIHAVLDTQEKLYAADSRVIDGCQSQGFSEYDEIAICNSKGLDLQWKGNTVGIFTMGVVSDGQEMSNDFKLKLGKLESIDTAAMAKEAVESAISKMGGEPAPTGQYPVIFNPDAMSSLLQCFSSIFSSESAQKGLSRFDKSEGEMVASEAVTLVDDPFHPESPLPINFDAEGSPTYTKNIIEKGRLNTLLYNLKTANQAGKQTTGNASKAGYDAPVSLRPFTMYLANGQLTEEELLAKAGNGVYINSLEGLHAGANPISGDFSLQSAGYMIEDGRKTAHVKSFTVAGNFYDLLKNITALANNCHLPMAMGMTAFGAPSTLVEGLSVAGK